MKFAEIVLWSAGALMLALYFGARAHGDHEARQGIVEFERAVAAASVQPAPAEAVAIVETPEWVTAEYRPALDDWADYRVRLYERDSKSSPGAPAAVLRIPRIDLAVPVYDELNERNLNRGAAHIAGTAPISATGNVGIAAHRDSFFRGLQHVAVGDVIEVESLRGKLEYRITELSVVEPDDVSVLSPTDGPVVTLVTCYPFYFAGHAPQRFIVRAEAVN